jgi:hypothetical protein
VADWLKAAGEQADNQGNWVTTKGIDHALGLAPASGTDIAPGKTDIVLLISASMFRAATPGTTDTGNVDPYACTSLDKDNTWIGNNFPNHYIILLSKIVPSADNSTVQFSFWSWGTKFNNVVVSQADFAAFYYGAIIGYGFVIPSTP